MNRTLLAELQTLLNALEHRDVIVKPCACWPDDVTPLVIAHKPRCVLFSGHGGVGEQHSLAFETRDGELQMPSHGDVIKCLSFDDRLEAVVLNACKTLRLAHAIRDALMRGGGGSASASCSGDGDRRGRSAAAPAIAGVVCWAGFAETAMATRFSRGFFVEVASQVERRARGEIVADEPPALPLQLVAAAAAAAPTLLRRPSFFDGVDAGEPGASSGGAASAAGEAAQRVPAPAPAVQSANLGGVYDCFVAACAEFRRAGGPVGRRPAAGAAGAVRGHRGKCAGRGRGGRSGGRRWPRRGGWCTQSAALSVWR